ncbi:Hypothetical protein AA314_07495 [Archangium gephyra]|uniref:Uncharacterized protein n=1 Tax=Archangium gephyra TaxID=48 RepID=A0AAC8QE98_9BACT|nr:Hypothetical protein AA314_07495 [Archangium gephyra]
MTLTLSLSQGERVVALKIGFPGAQEPAARFWSSCQRV